MIARVLNSTDRGTVLSTWQRLVAVGLLALFGTLTFAAVASAESRTLKLYFVHTRERAEITYKKNGRYLSGGLKEINRFLRDWRRNEPTKMDPRLLDLVWEVYKKSGSRDYIHVISAYRSPATNAMLRKRGRGVANKSQHMLGKAMDFYLPDVKLATLRRLGLQMQVGGVGYYPSSGSPFVHLDVGSVRHWPRMSRGELIAMFPDGKTLHVPTDGKPLPGYQQALASYNKRQKSGGGVVVASAARTTEEKPERRGAGFLAAFFGGGQDDEEDTIQAATAPKPVKTIPAPAVNEEQPQTPEMIIASLSERDVPLPLFASRPETDAVELAAADSEETQPAEFVVALAIPKPTPRPEITETAIASRIDTAAEKAGATLVASAGDDGVAEALAIMSAGEPDSKGGRIIAVPLPEKRPDDDNQPVIVAAIPDRERVLDVGPSRFGVPTLRAREESRKSARLSSFAAVEPPAETGKEAPAPRDIILASIEPVDPTEAIATGIRTTKKAGKPVAADKPAEPHVTVVPLPDDMSHRAFSKTHIARAEGSSRAPSFVFDLVGHAPREVYTAGFSRTARISNPYRFTGKAVQFLAVAKFD